MWDIATFIFIHQNALVTFTIHNQIKMLRKSEGGIEYC